MAAKMSASWCKNFIKLNIPKLSSKQVLISNIYLRDNSQEPSCFNKTSLQRVHNTSNIDLEIHPTNVDIINDDAVKVTWSDKHESIYDLEWIRENVVRTQRETKVRKVTWKSVEMNAEKVSLPYKDVLNEREAMGKYWHVSEVRSVGVEKSPLRFYVESKVSLKNNNGRDPGYP